MTTSQLIEQLNAARAELQEARSEYAAKIAKTKAHFDAEAAAMRRELTEALAQLNRLKVTMFAAWQRRESDAIN
jgi:chromosome segregation ATPase